MPANFRVLDAADRVQAAQWVEAWELWPGREVAAHPTYVRLFCEAGDRAVCAALFCDSGGVLFPLILRPLAREPWAADLSAIWDATTPYGYGGPFCWGQVNAAEFWSEYRAWARAASVISCFARLSLFDNQLLSFDGDVKENRPNVVRWLDLGADAMWMDYEHKVRKNVNRALREGVEVEVDLLGTRMGEFLRVYHTTLDRREARDGYYCDASFVQGFASELRGNVAFFNALHRGKVVSTELALVGAEHVYSFLGGTLTEAFDVRPNDLLKHRIIEWSREQGKKAYVLGGGYAADDGIFRYKRSFAPHGVVPFRVGEQILDTNAYECLVTMRSEAERAAGRVWKPQPGFFPQYRA